MQRVAEAFAVATRELDASTDVVGATIRMLNELEFEKWKRIGEYGSADRTWAFSLLFFVDGLPFYKIIAFYRRHRADAYDPYSDADGLVALTITGLEAKSTSRPDFHGYKDSHIRLREVLFLGDELVAYEQALPDETVCPSENVTIDEVIQQLFEDVFYRKAGIAS